MRETNLSAETAFVKGAFLQHVTGHVDFDFVFGLKRLLTLDALEMPIVHLTRVEIQSVLRPEFFGAQGAAGEGK